MNKMALSIITPDREVFNGEITSVTVPGSQGQFQVLFNHAPIVSTLDKGPIKIKAVEGNGEKEIVMQVDGGVVEVMKNDIKILVERILDTANA